MMRLLISVTAFTLIVQALVFPPPSYARDEFVIGLIPEGNIFVQVKKHKPLAEYLSSKLGVKVRFTILSRYPDIIDRFKARKLDGAFFGIFTSILAHEKIGVEPIARPVNEYGKSTSQSYIIVKKNSPIKTARNMRNKRVVYVDRATATGYLFIQAYLREAGVKSLSGYFSGQSFTGSHEAAIYTVLTDRADIGVVKSRIFDKFSKKDPLIREQLRIIAKSDPLPDVNLCVKSNLPPELKNKLRDALLSLHESPEGKKVLKSLQITHYIPTAKSDFSVVYKMAAMAGITDLKTFKYR